MSWMIPVTVVAIAVIALVTFATVVIIINEGDQDVYSEGAYQDQGQSNQGYNEPSKRQSNYGYNEPSKPEPEPEQELVIINEPSEPEPKPDKNYGPPADNSYPNYDIICPSQHYVSREGQCERCQDYQITFPSDPRYCIYPKCPYPERQFITRDGQCQYCGNYEVISSSVHGKQNCVEPDCGSLFHRVTKEGKCFDCRDDKWYYIASEDKRSCVPATCNLPETKPLPNISLLQKGLNLLAGDAKQVRPKYDLYYLTCAGTRENDQRMAIPDFVDAQDTPVLQPQCQQSALEMNSYKSSSLQDLQSKSSDTQRGIDSDLFLIEIGLAWGSSSYQETQTSNYREGYTESFVRKQKATLYEVQIDSSKVTDEFIQSFEAIEGVLDAFKFMQNYGTHYITSATLGASVESTISYSSRMTQDQKIKVQQESQQYSIDFKAKLIYEKEKEKDKDKDEDEDEDEDEKTIFNYREGGGDSNMRELTSVVDQREGFKVSSMISEGTIDSSGSANCDGLGTENNPVVLEYNYQPMYKIKFPRSNQMQKQANMLKNFDQQIFDWAMQCGAENCNRNGMCEPKQQFWFLGRHTVSEDRELYNVFFDDKKCICFTAPDGLELDIHCNLCAAGQYVDLNGKCSQCPDNQFYDAIQRDCTCSIQQYKAQQVRFCALSTYDPGSTVEVERIRINGEEVNGSFDINEQACRDDVTGSFSSPIDKKNQLELWWEEHDDAGPDDIYHRTFSDWGQNQCQSVYEKEFELQGAEGGKYVITLRFEKV